MNTVQIKFESKTSVAADDRSMEVVHCNWWGKKKEKKKTGARGRAYAWRNGLRAINT